MAIVSSSLLPIVGLIGALCSSFTTASAAKQPNLIFIMADDLGYGDITGFGGNPTSETPHLNRMITEGLRFQSMYSASPVCSPSRSAVITGRFMTRNGVWPGVFSPNSIGGLALNETTLPSVLKAVGYDTFMAGKWHLGVGPKGEYLPANRGFDHYYGVPYGIDMCSQDTVMDIIADGYPAGACFAPNISCKTPQYVGGHANGGGREYETPCPFYIDTTIVEQPTSLLGIDDKYVDATVSFIEAHKASADANPFFIYFCSHHTHAPAFAKANFTNTSLRGWFGDHLRTLDWSVGAIVNAVDASGIAEDTLIMFSADNGPSLAWEDLGGFNGGMRCGKGTTWEGGQRVPSIARWPGTVAPNTITRQMTSSMDFFATAIELAGAKLPTDRTIDAISYVNVLKESAGFDPEGKGHFVEGGRETFYYWGESPDPKIGLHAVRHETKEFGNWKMHWVTQGSHCESDWPDKECPSARGLRVLVPEDYLLYNLDVSVGETRNLSVAAYPDIVAKLTSLKREMEAEGDAFGPSQVKKGADNDLEPCAPSARASGCNASNPNSTSPHWPLCCQKRQANGWLQSHLHQKPFNEL